MIRTLSPLAAGLVPALSLALAAPAMAQDKTFRSELAPLKVETVTTGLANPWALAFLPDGAALVTERAGRLRLLTSDGLSEPMAGVPEVATVGQGGLLDVAVARDFETSGIVFLSFSEPGRGGAGTAVARAKLVREGQTARLDNVEVIFSMSKKTAGGNHFGSRIVVNDDGTLFVTTGDRGEGPRAQDMNDHAGAVLRIGADGAIPADNPAPDGKGQLPEIWSKGHRNIQGAALDPANGRLVTVEHGARGGDEINHPEPGKNYGWPMISYGVNYDRSKIGVGTEADGYEQPVHYWDPSIAPSGLVVYDGAMFPEWRGHVFVGALRGQLLSRLDRDAEGGVKGEERLLEGEFGRIRDVRQAPDGALWLLTDEDDGAILRLSRAGG